MNKAFDALMLISMPIPLLPSRGHTMTGYTNALETVGALNATFDLKRALRAASYRLGDVRRRWEGVRSDSDDRTSMRGRGMISLARRAEIYTAVDTMIGCLAEAHP